MEEMDVNELILSVKDHEAIYDAPRCEQGNRDHLASVWMKIAQIAYISKEQKTVSPTPAVSLLTQPN
jgi:hypothetical protein